MQEVTELREQLEEMLQRLTESEGELKEARARIRETEGEYQRLLQEQESAQASAELRTFRAVATETKKWEEREARLVERIEELKQGNTGRGEAGTVGAGGSGANGREGIHSEMTETHRAAIQPPRDPKEAVSPRSAVTKVRDGCEPEREIRGQIAGVCGRSTPQFQAATGPHRGVPHPTSEHSAAAAGDSYSNSCIHTPPPPLPPHTPPLLTQPSTRLT